MNEEHSAAPATVLGRYVLGPRLAAGSLGTVVAATDARTGREVAVKFFDGASDNYGAWVDEMRLAVRLAHPNIVACIDAGHDPEFDLSVLVFARAMGGSLRRALVSGVRLDDAAVHLLLTEIAAALAHAHAHGVVHRDVKPENILALARLGEPPWALTDFGAGRFLARGHALRSLAGSVAYMAPEVTLGAADAASDLYSLGVVALELLTGERGDLAARTAFRLDQTHRRGAGLPALVACLLDPDPVRRVPGSAALVAALAAAPAGFDVAHTRGGARWLLAGDEVAHCCGETGRLRPLGRVPRARRFIHEPDDDMAIVAGDRRVVGLDARPTTLLASDERFTPFVASRRHAAIWLLQGDRLVRSDLAGHSMGWRAAMPATWLPALRSESPALTGLALSSDAALLGVLGCSILLIATRVPDGLRLTPLPAPAPVYALLRRGADLLVHCGDARIAQLLRVEPGGLRLLERRARPVDAVTVAAEPDPPRLVDLAQELEGGPHV